MRLHLTPGYVGDVAVADPGGAYEVVRTVLIDLEARSDEVEIDDHWPSLVCWDAETGGMACAPATHWATIQADPGTWALLLTGRLVAGPLHSYLVYRLTRGLWHLSAEVVEVSNGSGWPSEVQAPEPWPASGVLTDPTITGRPIRLRPLLSGPLPPGPLLSGPFPSGRSPSD